MKQAVDAETWEHVPRVGFSQKGGLLLYTHLRRISLRAPIRFWRPLSVNFFISTAKLRNSFHGNSSSLTLCGLLLSPMRSAAWVFFPFGRIRSGRVVLNAYLSPMRLEMIIAVSEGAP